MEQKFCDLRGKVRVGDLVTAFGGKARTQNRTFSGVVLTVAPGPRGALATISIVRRGKAGEYWSAAEKDTRSISLARVVNHIPGYHVPSEGRP